MFILPDIIGPNAGIPPKEITLILRNCFILNIIHHHVIYNSKIFNSISMGYYIVMKNVEYKFTGGQLLPFILNLIFYEYYVKAWQESPRKLIRLVRHRSYDWSLAGSVFFMVI